MTRLSTSLCIMQLRIKQHRARGESAICSRTITLWAVLSFNAHLQESDGNRCPWYMPEKQNHAQNLHNAAAAEQRLVCDTAFNQRCCFRVILMLNASGSTAKSNKLWPEAWAWVCLKHDNLWSHTGNKPEACQELLSSCPISLQGHASRICSGVQGQEQPCSKWTVTLLSFP